ncbi:Polyadenylate-binding protein rbp45 [Orobanche hederae]
MMQQPGGMAPPQMGMDQQQPPPQQHQYPPQQWMMMPPQHQPPQTQQSQYWPQQQQQHYGAPPANVVAAAPAGGGVDEVRTLWIGDLQYYMDENYLTNCFYNTGELVSAKVIRNKQTGQAEGYGFLEFRTHAAAESILQSYNGSMMPSSEQTFRMNWASLGAGDKRTDNSPEHTIFVGDLAGDVTDYVLQETFKVVYQSVKGAKVVTDRATGRSKGYGFVKFGDEREQQRAMTEMNGVLCSTRPMRIGPAANKKPMTTPTQSQAAPYQNSQGGQGEGDPSNTTIFVGGLDPSVTDDYLKQVFSQYGELVHVKIPVGKRCGFVQFADRSCAEQALSNLNGTMLGGQNIRLSWGRSPSNKQSDQNQWGGGGYFGGYPQGYEGNAGYAPPQDPNMYYAGYPGYANYQQPQQIDTLGHWEKSFGASFVPSPSSGRCDNLLSPYHFPK